MLIIFSQFGDFNNWNREEFSCTKDQYGVWSVTLKPNPDGSPRLAHNSKYKIQVTGPDGAKVG